MRLRKTMVALALSALPVVAAGGPASAASGTETFRLFFTGTFVFGGSNTGSVFASGPINAAGSAVNSGFIVDQFGQFTGNNVLRFDEGTLFVNFAGSLDSFDFDPRTCVTRITGHGTWEVADASDDLAGTTGGGTFRNDVTLIQRRTASGCSEETTEVSRITLTGPIETPDGVSLS
jgi:hypothetical protein